VTNSNLANQPANSPESITSINSLMADDSAHRPGTLQWPDLVASSSTDSRLPEPGAPIVEHIDTSVVLTHQLPGDAHFAAYFSSKPPRLKKATVGPEGVEIVVTLFVIDVDCPEVHGTKRLPPASWIDAEGAKLDELDRVHPAIQEPLGT
jgi:hypothetical protein